ncbi:MAG: sulfur relay protein DsrC [endosymbiont of Escarpia spicata]|uniref:Sulfur relay protein DsrC n=1 Tax=endosymbiont of Escarpia spicata TaxID=2200908 RepID=A0A370DF95_9GAMM|nr:MAG: sulfur relay protein DsrC [endosymbiont of Escarpia spicata]
MSDILQHIRSPASNQNDPDGNLLELVPWSEDAAVARAQELGIALSNDHWDVVLFVRDYYRGRGEKAKAREITKALVEEFAEDGGKKWLYQLFPRGPVNQASYIAGIRVPGDANDPSFGSTH